jgi:hypothetical protein
MADSDSKSFTRRQLYELVWKTPVDRLAKEFGLSGRGLGKVCERHGIPVPPRGYWAQEGAARRALKKPLIEFPSETPGKSEAAILAACPKTPDSSDPAVEPVDIEYKGLWAELTQTFSNAKIGKTLTAAHPVVTQLLEADQADAARYRGYGSTTRKSYSIYKSALSKRQMRIVSAVFRHLEAEGFKGQHDPRAKEPFSVRREGVQIDFKVYEPSKRIRRPLTEEEKAQSWNADRKWIHEMVESGMLKLQITTWAPSGIPTEWQDTPEQLLDAEFGKILASFLVTYAFQAKAEAERRVKEQQQRKLEAEEARIKEERRQEAIRHTALAGRARLWRKAAGIRSYVDTVLEAFRDGKVSAKEDEVTAWAAWARTYADEIDPLTSGDALSTEPLPEPKKQQPGFGTWGQFGYGNKSYY